MVRMLVLVVLLAACGSNKPLFAPADKVAGSGSGSGSGSNAEAAKRAEKATMPPEVAKLHDALAKHSCDALGDIQADTAAIATATPPTTANADAWTNATNALVAASGELDTACRSNDTAQVDAAFGKLDDGYQALLAAAGGK